MPVLQSLLDALPWRSGRPAGNAAILDANASGLNGRRRPLSKPNTTGGEYGTSGTENYGGIIRRKDPNHNLDNFLDAVVIYDKMRNGDAQINAMLSVLKLPLRRATWVALAPDGADPVDKAVADFVTSCLFDDESLEYSWDYTLRHILLQLDYGFSVLEVVWRVDEQGYYRFERLAPRLPKTIIKWHVDTLGRLVAITQYAPVPQTIAVGRGRGLSDNTPNDVRELRVYETTSAYKELIIPAEYALVFSLNREGDNYEGRSILRTAYRNWFYKDNAYRTEGIRLDRWGVGIPMAKLTSEHTLDQAELDQLVDVLKKVRANERAFLIAPPGVDYDLLPKTGAATSGSGAIQWIEHHDQQIARNVLAGFLTMGTDPHGTLGFGSRLTDMFVSSLNGIAAGIGADLKQQLVRKLCDLNFNMTGRKYPRITCRDLEQQDTMELVNALAILAKIQFLQPDDDTERLLRKILKLPELKHEVSRKGQANAQPGTQAAAMPTSTAADQTHPQQMPSSATPVTEPATPKEPTSPHPPQPTPTIDQPPPGGTGA